LVASGAGDSIPGDGRTVILASNPTGGAITITAESNNADNFGITHATAHDAGPLSVPAGQFIVFGPFPKERFNDATQKVQLSYSGAGLVLWPITL
jgi:hypothetical protein